MQGSYENNIFNMPMTLERHLAVLAEAYPQVRELNSLWVLLKKRLEEELSYSRGVFVNYSLHDGTHSRSIIQAVERFLGAERIRKLSATDTFMLLVCAYAHDYGMAYSFNRVYDILGSDSFLEFIEEKGEKGMELEEEDMKALQNLINYLHNDIDSIPLNQMYFSMQLVLQLYLRLSHWEGVIDLKECLRGLFQGHIKSRFFQGIEGITEVCMAHGQAGDSLLKLSYVADGIVGDDYHPRFVAAMIRLGDLLDIDNDRFPAWFVREVLRERNLIPHLSVLHYRKHEAISHLLVTPGRIEITAHCHSGEDGYDVAYMVNDWTDWVEEECRALVLHWSEVAQPDFGRPPSEVRVEIYVDGERFQALHRKAKMQMSQERVMALLEGSSIYSDRYVGIREVVQNAVDASLLQLWQDILQNRYVSYQLSKDAGREGLDMLEILKNNRRLIFDKYSIAIELIKDIPERKIYIVVKDKGIAITGAEVEHLADIGSSKENNRRLQEIMDKMPPWLKPAGIFGIGLQSVFQLTDCIELYTRLPNEPEKQITLYSYGTRRGKIQVQDVPANGDGLFYDNAIPGTNVKICVNPEKLFREEGHGIRKGGHAYFDPEFDEMENLDILFAALETAIKDKVRENRVDYFNIYLYPVIRKGPDDVEKKKRITLRNSFFSAGGTQGGNSKWIKAETLYPLLKSQEGKYCFMPSEAYYWDEKSNRYYHVTIRRGKVKEGERRKQIYLPETAANLYHVSYKFNPIKNTDSIYTPSVRNGQMHAGFLEWDILIMDDRPAYYLNIDRERLKEGSVTEEELLLVRQKIAKKWCGYFIEKNRAKAEPGGKHGNEILLEKDMETLISVIFLFFQSVPREQFRKFMQPYKNLLEKESLVLGEEHIPLNQLWETETVFQTTLPMSEAFGRLDVQKDEAAAIPISSDTIAHIPHRLIQIGGIRKNERNELQYSLRLYAAGSGVVAVDMDRCAMLQDYLGAMEADEVPAEKIYYERLQKTVFKPDSRYRSLLLHCYPQTFKRGKNFSSSLDCCIQWYILSPFDQEAGNMLKAALENRQPDQAGQRGGEFCEYVMNSAQMQKCISYILKKRTGQSVKGNSEEEEKQIREEYQSFVKSFFNLFYDNYDIVKAVLKKEQDKDRKAQKQPVGQ